MAAAIVGSNDIAWERTFGNQDVDRLVAVKPDTPFHLDGLTQTLAAAVTLRCVEEGRVLLSDRIERFAPGSPEAGATIRQILTHTSGADGGVFSYQLSRLDALSPVIESCAGSPFRFALASLLDRFAMINSVPGFDSIWLAPSNAITQSKMYRYAGVLDRLAVPYAVDQRGHASKSEYPTKTITQAAGLVSTARDF